MGQRGEGGKPRSLARDRLEAALEASCEALVGLQLIRKVGGDDVNAHANRAIDSLRRAIVELRAAGDEQKRVVGHGFVIGERAEASPERE